jgi:Bacteriophage HK97-gp10, putative tail-component
MIDISKEITKALTEYTQEVTEGLEKAKKDIAKDTAKELKKTSPELTGDYRKGWAVKKVGTAQVVHNRTDYQLTHLLEKGHAKRGGGRVAAIPHIRPAEQRAIREYVEQVEKVIKG